MATEIVRNDLTIYDAAAEQWWSEEVRWVRTLRKMVPARLKWFDRHVEWPQRRVLDLGCAGGFMAEAMHDRGAVVTGFDPAEDAVAAARRHASETGRRIGYDVGVGEALPYQNEAFDIVVCVDVLEHVESVPKVLSEVRRVLRPGGAFLFDTINRNVLSRLATITIAEDVLGLLPKGTHDPQRFIKPGELRDALDTVGLRPGAMTGLGPAGLTLRGDFTFAALPFRTIIYMGVATKPSSGS